MASDSAYPTFQHYGTNAQRLAFTPSPAAGTQPIYLWKETDTGYTFLYDTSWHQIVGSAPGAVPIEVTTNTTVAAATGWVVPEQLEIDGGVSLEIAGGAIVEITGAVGVVGVLAGSQGGGLVFLSQVTTSGSQSTVDFQNIPQTYNALKLIYSARDTASGTGRSAIRIRLNNDSTSANYTAAARVGAYNAASVVSSIAGASGGGSIGAQPNDGNTIGIVSTGEVLIVGYAATTFHKRILASVGYEDTQSGVELEQFRWTSFAAINRVTVTTDGTAFKDGLVWTLYGMN